MSFKLLFTLLVYLSFGFKVTKISGYSVQSRGRSKQRRSEILEYAPLRCNTEATIDIESDECLANSVGLSIILSYNSTKTDPVTIPCGRCVVVDHEDGSTIDIPGGLHVLGRLHFPSLASVRLRTTAIFVQGVWSMDTPANGKSVEIALHGTEEQYFYPHDLCCGAAANIFSHASCDVNCEYKKNMGKKPFVVAGGRLDIRAIDKECPSWTKLKNMDLAANSLTLDSKFARCLRPGDELLVTSDQKSYRRSSTYTVSLVAEEMILLDNATMLPRVLPSEAGPGEPEFAVEVALLRRDVVFTAESDPDDDLIGGHSIVYHTPNLPQIIEGVKFDNFGQSGNLGKYPIHFHISRYSPSLVSKNVIVNSNHRCVFIHDTDYVTIHDNVAYKTSGHCYSTEIGTERYNTFSNNLGADTQLLTRSNGQSDSPGDRKHQAATFWFRNMENTIVGNVAAGSQSIGFWIELTDIFGNQLNQESFKDNVAHSNKEGLLTYRRGWKPINPAVVDNFKVYKNYDGFKFHITGNIKFTNCIIADNYVGIRYGAWNTGIILEDSTIIGLSRDARLRMGKVCPSVTGGIVASFNNGPEREGQIVMKNVNFTDFTCDAATIVSYNDGRLYDGMGDPIVSFNVSIVNSTEASKPKFSCDPLYQDIFMEDFDGTLGPSGKGPGFLVQNNEHAKAFLPDALCEVLPYDAEACTSFCENVCIRLAYLKPVVGANDGPVTHEHVVVTDQHARSHTYSIDYDGKAKVVLPSGQYHVEFLDADGNVTEIESLSVETFRTPRCEDFVTPADFTLITPSPTLSPTVTPRPTSVPTATMVPTHSKFPTVPPTFSGSFSSDPTLFVTTSLPPALRTESPSPKRTTVAPTASPTSSHSFSPPPTVLQTVSDSPTVLLTTSPSSSEPTMSATSSELHVVNWAIPLGASLPNRTVTVGDTVVFEWIGFHNVAIHPSGTCDPQFSRVVGSSSETLYKFAEEDVGEITFACEVGIHCDLGQIITFTVLPKPTASVTSSPTQSPPYVLAATDSKCPYKDDSRLFRDSPLTLEECHEHCRDRPSCQYFSHQESSGLCLGCDSLALPLETTGAGGIDSYELTSLRTFPYELKRSNEKCAVADRLSQTYTSTREDCYDLCEIEDSCDLFTFGETWSLPPAHRNLCFLCSSDASLDNAYGFNTYAIPS